MFASSSTLRRVIPRYRATVSGGTKYSMSCIQTFHICLGNLCRIGVRINMMPATWSWSQLHRASLSSLDHGAACPVRELPHPAVPGRASPGA